MGQEIDWNDKETEKEMRTDNIERYTAEDDRLDLVRILTVPVKYFVHIIDRTYCNCGKADGKKGQCILCDRDIDRAVKVGVVIVHIASKTSKDKKWQVVGTCKVWLFGRDKMKSIRKLLNKHADGVPEEWLKKQDLFIDCVKQQFQELEIEWTHKPSRINKNNAKKYCANFKKAKEQLEWFTRSSDKNRQKKVLGMDVDEDANAIDDINDDPIDVDIDDSMAVNPEPESKSKSEPEADEVDDLLKEMDDPFAVDPGDVPF